MPSDPLLYRLTAQIRDYAWGSTTLLAELTSREPTGAPEAEVWMGAHPASPATLIEPCGRHVALDVWLEEHPEQLAALPEYNRLPFLVKLLAAGRPLSIQAHPSLELARAGFAQDNAAEQRFGRIQRNYVDDNHKPEMLVALTEFSALCGLRSGPDAAASFRRLAELGGTDQPNITHHLRRLAEKLDAHDLQSVFHELLEPESAWHRWAAGVIAWMRFAQEKGQLTDPYLRTALDVAEYFPTDPGVLVTVLMNRIDLHTGEALQVPPGMLHAYLHGMGLEVMASSDNVLRGGLTAKHIDVAELDAVVNFHAVDKPYCYPQRMRGVGTDGPGPEDLLVDRFRPNIGEYVADRYQLGTSCAVDLLGPGPVIAVCTAGQIRLTAAEGRKASEQGGEDAGTLASSPDHSLVLSPGESTLISTQAEHLRAQNLAASDHSSFFVVGMPPA